MVGLDRCCCVREEAKGSLCKQHKSNTDSCARIVASSSIEIKLPRAQYIGVDLTLPLYN